MIHNKLNMFMLIATVALLSSCQSNQPPNAQAGPGQTVDVGENVALRGSASDPNGTVQTYLADVVSSMGLICNLIGVILLFKYGLPSEIEIPLIMPGSDEEVLEQNRRFTRYRRNARLGLVLLILGVVFQLFSNWIE